MRFVVYGAGAVGGVIAARLHLGGVDVQVVARGPHLEAIRHHGLRLVTPHGEDVVPLAGRGLARRSRPRRATRRFWSP